MKLEFRGGMGPVAGLLAVWICAAPSAAMPGEDEPAPVHFANSCTPGVQEKFQQAVTLLHSFEYPETTRIFAEVIAQEPSCAMAYWGAAMSIWRPLWAPPSVAELERGAALLAKTEGLAVTPREAAFLEASRAFFASADPATHGERARAFEQRMGEVHARCLDDPEAALFYALALLATADPRDQSYAQQYKAGAILSWVERSDPRHPGVLHYTIHAYDYPGLAHLALDAAKEYAQAAPDSAHAQHMPSHIFTRLGLWELSLASNHDSTRSAAHYTHRAQLPGHYDEGLHSMDYLMYALLQTARHDEARELLGELARIERTDTEGFKVAYTYAASPARYALERRQWEEASRLAPLRPDFGWQAFPWARSMHHFARGLGAARSGHLDQARQELAAIEALERELPETTLPYWREQVRVERDAVRSWILLAEGDADAALALASAAADREDAVDKHPVTPGEVLPARELYADMLFETGAFGEALAQYQRVLQGAPNRLNALVGAANAAANAGDAGLAERYSATVRDQVRFGDPRQLGVAQIGSRRPG